MTKRAAETIDLTAEPPAKRVRLDNTEEAMREAHLVPDAFILGLQAFVASWAPNVRAQYAAAVVCRSICRLAYTHIALPGAPHIMTTRDAREALLLGSAEIEVLCHDSRMLAAANYSIDTYPHPALLYEARVIYAMKGVPEALLAELVPPHPEPMFSPINDGASDVAIHNAYLDFPFILGRLYADDQSVLPRLDFARYDDPFNADKVSRRFMCAPWMHSLEHLLRDLLSFPTRYRHITLGLLMNQLNDTSGRHDDDEMQSDALDRLALALAFTEPKRYHGYSKLLPLQWKNMVGGGYASDLCQRVLSCFAAKEFRDPSEYAAFLDTTGTLSYVSLCDEAEHCTDASLVVAIIERIKRVNGGHISHIDKLFRALSLNRALPLAEFEKICAAIPKNRAYTLSTPINSFSAFNVRLLSNCFSLERLHAMCDILRPCVLHLTDVALAIYMYAMHEQHYNLAELHKIGQFFADTMKLADFDKGITWVRFINLMHSYRSRKLPPLTLTADEKKNAGEYDIYDTLLMRHHFKYIQWAAAQCLIMREALPIIRAVCKNGGGIMNV